MLTSRLEERHRRVRWGGLAKCRTDFMANLVLPRPKPTQPEVATQMMRTIYQQVSRQRSMANVALELTQGAFRQVAELLGGR